MLYSDTKPCPIFLKLVFVKPRMSRWNVWTCELNTESSLYCLCLLYPQYPKFGPPKWCVLHEIKGNIKKIRQFPNMTKLSRPSPNFAHKRSFLNITEDLSDIHGIELFALVNYFAHKLCLLIALFEFTKRARRSKTDAHNHLRECEPTVNCVWVCMQHEHFSEFPSAIIINWLKLEQWQNL